MHTPRDTLGSGGIDLVLQNPLHYSGLQIRSLRRWLTGVLVDSLAPGREGVSLTVRFVSDRQIRGLNRRYRGSDRPTDVLSFQGDAPADESPGAASPGGFHLGDLVISVPMARRQAARLGHSSSREIQELILHGFLHLLGYDHEDDRSTMDAIELEMRRRWIPEDDD